jgi:hypothetical protein
MSTPKAATKAATPKAATPSAAPASKVDPKGKAPVAAPGSKRKVFKQGLLKKQGGSHGGWKTWKKR